MNGKTAVAVVIVAGVAVATALMHFRHESPTMDHARYTVDEYRRDTHLREQQFQRCTNDPGTLGKAPDCINALEAERIEGMGHSETRFRPSPWSTKAECLEALREKSEQIRASACNKLPDKAQR
jgi:hypothetical protein